MCCPASMGHAVGMGLCPVFIQDFHEFFSQFSFPDGSVVKNPPAMQEMQEMQVEFLVWEDSLEEEMATHSSILAWEIPCTEEPGRLQSMGSQGVRHDQSS